jgi:hypothetical protein
MHPNFGIRTHLSSLLAKFSYFFVLFVVQNLLTFQNWIERLELEFHTRTHTLTVTRRQADTISHAARKRRRSDIYLSFRNLVFLPGGAAL